MQGKDDKWVNFKEVRQKKCWSDCCNPDRHNRVNISHKSSCGVKNMWFILLLESETKNCSIFIPAQLAMLLCNGKIFQHSVNVELDILNVGVFSFMVNAAVVQTRIIFAGPKALLASQPFAEERCDAGVVPSHTHSHPLCLSLGVEEQFLGDSARRHGWSRYRAALHVHKYSLARDAALMAPVQGGTILPSPPSLCKYFLYYCKYQWLFPRGTSGLLV